MVNRELIEVFSEIAREKNVERSELASILEELFLYIIEREYGDSSNCSCIVNLDKGEIEIYDHNTWRPYCHLKDFARLIYKSYTVDPKLINGQVFNAGSNRNNYNKIQIAHAIKKYINGKIKIIKESKDKRNYKVDFNKLEKKLGFKCIYGLDYGIRTILQSLKKQKKNKLKKNFLLVILK